SAARERVLFGQHGKQALRKQRKGVEFVATDGQREDGDVDDAGAQAIEQDRRDFFHHGELGLRKLTREGGQLGRQEVRRDRRDHADNERAGDGILALDDITPGGLQLPQYSAS